MAVHRMPSFGSPSLGLPRRRRLAAYTVSERLVHCDRTYFERAVMVYLSFTDSWSPRSEISGFRAGASTVVARRE
jgi:hypothetical protein